MSQEPPPPTEGTGIVRRALVPICLCFAVGIVLADVAGLPVWIWAAFFLICVAGALLGKTEKALFATVLAGCFFGGAAWYGLRAMPLLDDISHFVSQQPVEMRGFVSERQVLSDGRVNLRVRAQHLLTLEGERAVSGTTIVYPKGDTEARSGDEVRCLGRIQRPLGPSNWGQFSFEKYLNEHGVYSVFFGETIEVIPAEKKPPLQVLASWLRRPSLSALSTAGERKIARWVEGAQKAIYIHLAKSLPRRNRSLIATVLCGLLFGDRSYPLPEALGEAFRRSGTIHIMVVSGTQVSLIAAFVFLLVRRSPLPIWAGSLIAAGLLFLYVLTVGGTPSVLRAGVMTGVAMLAAIFSRRRDIYNSLSFALLVLLILNPASLFDVSLQLSFLATFGIITIATVLIKAVPQVPKIISGAAAVTIGSQVMVAPALTYYFHRLPLVGFVANLVVVPCVAPLMGLGIGMLVLSFFWPMAAGALGMLAAPLVEFIVGTASTFAHWSWAGVEQVGISPPGVLIWYACILGLTSLLFEPVRKAITRERAVLAATILAVVGGIWLVAKSPTPTFSVTALDVQRGFCSIAQTPKGASLIIDGGGPAAERWNAGETIILPFLLQQHIHRIDAILVTDLDHDHTAGLAPVLTEMPVKRLILLGRGSDSSSSERMLHAAQENNVEVFWSGSQQRLDIHKDVELTPGASPSLGGEGAHFVVLAYGNVDLIWAMGADQQPLANLPSIKGKRVVLFLPVGTRPTAELQWMLATGSVAGVILSPRNRFDNMDAALRSLVYSCNARVFRTDIDGAVRVETDGQTLTFRTFNGGR